MAIPSTHAKILATYSEEGLQKHNHVEITSKADWETRVNNNGDQNNLLEKIRRLQN